MNKYLILGPNFPTVSPAYRGIDRTDIPDIPNDPSKAQSINRTIEKYMGKRDLSVEGGEYLNDYNLASEIANSFTLNNEKGEVYEVVQVVNTNEEQPQNVKLLGYDVIGVNEHGSMIINFFSKKNLKTDSELENYRELLNDFFLFNKQNLAEEFCYLVGKKLGSGFSLKIVGIYL